MLLRKTFHKHVKGVKVIPGEGITKQHHVLVFNFCADIPIPAKKKFIPRLRIWCLREPEAQSEYQNAFIIKATSSIASGSGTEEM